MSKPKQEHKMRVSFDLDEVLFVNPETHKTEPRLPFPLRNYSGNGCGSAPRS